jgi:hypothetical protein
MTWFQDACLRNTAARGNRDHESYNRLKPRRVTYHSCFDLGSSCTAPSSQSYAPPACSAASLPSEHPGMLAGQPATHRTVNISRRQPGPGRQLAVRDERAARAVGCYVECTGTER